MGARARGETTNRKRPVLFPPLLDITPCAFCILFFSLFSFSLSPTLRGEKMLRIAEARKGTSIKIVAELPQLKIPHSLFRVLILYSLVSGREILYRSFVLSWCCFQLREDVA